MSGRLHRVIGVGALLTGVLGWGIVSAQTQAPPKTSPDTQPAASQPAGGATMKLTITSPAFAPGQRVPKRHTGEGEDLSPALAWVGVPPKTAELALIVDDPDAPPGDWVHWVIYKLPATAAGLAEGRPRTPTLTDPAGAVQGKNSWGTIGYRGPMPPPGHGTHHYHFKLYALDTPLALGPGATKAEVLAAMRGHILAEGDLIGTYSR